MLRSISPKLCFLFTCLRVPFNSLFEHMQASTPTLWFIHVSVFVEIHQFVLMYAFFII